MQNPSPGFSSPSLLENSHILINGNFYSFHSSEQELWNQCSLLLTPCLPSHPSRNPCIHLQNVPTMQSLPTTSAWALPPLTSFFNHFPAPSSSIKSKVFKLAHGPLRDLSCHLWVPLWLACPLLTLLQLSWPPCCSTDKSQVSQAFISELCTFSSVLNILSLTPSLLLGLYSHATFSSRLPLLTN